MFLILLTCLVLCNVATNGTPIENMEFFEGDIKLPLANTRNGLNDLSKRWHKNGEGYVIVPYTFGFNFGNSEKDKIFKGMADIQDKTCVRFEKRRTQRDYLVISSSSRGPAGCWSYMGRIGGPQNLNLKSGTCFRSVGITVHELMHALGFSHEQNREDRDNYVTIHWSNIIPRLQYNFQKNKLGTTSAFGLAYDYGSILHYGQYSASVNGKPTITPKKTGVTIGNAQGLSETDAMKINKMYKCEKFLR